jgi:hypothetical protein
MKYLMFFVLLSGCSIHINGPLKVGDCFIWGNQTCSVESTGRYSYIVKCSDNKLVKVQKNEVSGVELTDCLKDLK